MKEQKKQPELRFNGFTDDWEQRKLGELANIVRGASPRPIQDPKWFDKDSDIGWLRISDVTEQDGRIRHLEQRISKLGQEKTRVLMEPHLLLSIAATVGKPLVNYVKTGVHDGFLIFLNPVFDREFMFQWLDMFRPKWKKYGQPGSQVNLNSELVRNQEIDLPRIEEQQQIGSFFKQLDDIIALHQRKHDLLKKLKQGYLQQMFPVKNEVVPQLRFSGFKDDWGQSKFKNIIIRVNKSSNSNKLPKIEFEDISAGEGRLNKDISKKFDTRKGIEFEPNDILYGKLRPYLKNWLMPNFKGIALGDFWIFRSTNNISNFVYNLIQTNKYQKAANDTSGTKMPRSDWKKVSETMFFISKNLEEQQKIGEFFQKLDQDLSLQQLKIEQLQQLKQAYLQKLFP
ncbi:restriction endonuclease subunit S [Latilactobacillus curvatus]|uniref:restriction endonuclease subunit S n=1 Tax=Latilactobacillus curvatus TaxID=28038 RepID=UPI00217EBC1E|nr:restriction endonuclease subunit S [Latilactobacillus curvatus]MCS6143356.1 restriction endonuclease subunit S [Latilactobacillus curvatus]